MKFYQYCAKCGQRYSDFQIQEMKQGVSRIKCESCGLAIYNNPRMAVAAILVRDGQYLMSRRGIEPFRGTLDVAGGFCDYGEDSLESLQRELKEELNLDESTYDIRGILGTMHNWYNNGGREEEQYSVGTVFYVLETEREDFEVLDDVSGYEWIPLGTVSEDIGFPELKVFLTEYMDQLVEIAG